MVACAPSSLSVVMSSLCFSAVHRCFFTLDKTHIASFSDDKSVCLWDIPSESKVTSFSEHSVSRIYGFYISFSCMTKVKLVCLLFSHSENIYNELEPIFPLRIYFLFMIELSDSLGLGVTLILYILCVF